MIDPEQVGSVVRSARDYADEEGLTLEQAARALMTTVRDQPELLD